MINIKVQVRIEKELFREVDKTEKLKLGYSSSDLLKNDERIKTKETKK
jgi:hypothetical protein